MFGKKKKDELVQKTSRREMTKRLTGAFDAASYKYDFDAEKSILMTGFMGDDLPIPMHIAVDDVTMHFVCMLDLVSKPENFKNVLTELNSINRELAFGSFSLDDEEGRIVFSYGLPYVEADLSNKFIIEFIRMLVNTVDRHDGHLKEIAEAVPSSERLEFNLMYS